MTQRPKVGLGVILHKDGKVLLGKRKNAHGAGEWGFPGGHLEFGETYEACARREVMEEAGVTIKNLKFVTATNDIFEKENKHYVTVYISADYDAGLVRNNEPEKLEKWEWFSPAKLPTPLFTPIRNLLAQHKL